MVSVQPVIGILDRTIAAIDDHHSRTRARIASEPGEIRIRLDMEARRSQPLRRGEDHRQNGGSAAAMSKPDLCARAPPRRGPTAPRLELQHYSAIVVHRGWRLIDLSSSPAVMLFEGADGGPTSPCSASARLIASHAPAWRWGRARANSARPAARCRAGAQNA
jgi:hypothetical protein